MATAHSKSISTPNLALTPSLFAVGIFNFSRHGYTHSNRFFIGYRMVYDMFAYIPTAQQCPAVKTATIEAHSCTHCCVSTN